MLQMCSAWNTCFTCHFMAISQTQVYVSKFYTHVLVHLLFQGNNAMVTVFCLLTNHYPDDLGPEIIASAHDFHDWGSRHCRFILERFTHAHTIDIKIDLTQWFHFFEPFIITPFNTFEISSFGAIAPFSIIFSKVFKTQLNFFFKFFSMLSKNRKWCHGLKIAYGVKG